MIIIIEALSTRLSTQIQIPKKILIPNSPLEMSRYERKLQCTFRTL